MAIQWRCTLCGQCCKVYAPFVLPRDVERIQEATGQPPSSFITFYLPTDFDGEFDATAQRYLFHSKHGPLVMGLSRADLPNGDVGCVFLKDNLCTIHSARPLVCRQYPFEAEGPEPEGAFRLSNDPCFGRHALDETADEVAVRRNSQLFLHARSEFFKKVQEWNAHSESDTTEVEDFLSCIGLPWK